MALADFQDLVNDLVRDDTSKITAADVDQAIQLAVERYSKDRPRMEVEDLVAASAGHVLPMPTAWVADFSALHSLEYPIDEQPRCFMEAGEFWIYSAPGGDQIEVDSSLPSAASVRASFTIKHVVSGVEDTTPPSDREPIAAWAAAILLDQLASLFSGDSDSTIKADSVDHNSKAEEYAKRARDARRRYFNELGVDTKRPVPAGVVVDLYLKNSLGGARLTHR